MSSLVRKIWKARFRNNLYSYKGRGERLGVKNPADKALLARLAREEKRKNLTN